MAVGRLLLLWLGLAQLGWAQDAKQDFSAAVVGKQFVLRDFSAEKEVRYKWVDGALQSGSVRYFTFGIVTPEKVSYSRNRVTIIGHRQTAVLDGATHKLFAAPPRDPVQVVVDAGTTDVAQVVPNLRKALFFENVTEAVDAVPQEMRASVPLRVGDTPAQTAERGRQPDTPPTKVSAPVLLRAKDPAYSDEARQQGVSGIVLCGIIVSESGSVEEAWLLRPLGSGLDENALKAVRNYTFKPAEANGVAVKVFLKVEVKFQLETDSTLESDDDTRVEAV